MSHGSRTLASIELADLRSELLASHVIDTRYAARFVRYGDEQVLMIDVEDMAKLVELGIALGEFCANRGWDTDWARNYLVLDRGLGTVEVIFEHVTPAP